MSLFNIYQKTAQSRITHVMGDSAVWVPQGGGPSINASVLFKEPTDKAQIDLNDYDTARPSMEYFEGDLPGLFEIVWQNSAESILINGRSFVTIKNGSKKFDGKTIVVYLEEVYE